MLGVPVPQQVNQRMTREPRNLVTDRGSSVCCLSTIYLPTPSVWYPVSVEDLQELTVRIYDDTVKDFS